MSARKTYSELQKEYITHCVVCHKFIQEDQQSSVRKYCSKSCSVKHRDRRRVKVTANFVRTRIPEIIPRKVTRAKMQKEINLISLGKEEV